MIALDFTFDVTELVAAYEAAQIIQKVMEKHGSATASANLAKTAGTRFRQDLFAKSKANPKRFWHLYKSNRVGVPGHELFEIRAQKLNSSGEGRAFLEVRFLPNTEKLSVKTGSGSGHGTLTGYERQGVPLPSGNTSLGFRTSTKFKARQQRYRFPDRRDPSKSYTWTNQVQDVEFGRRIVINPRNSTNSKPRKSTTISASGRKRTKHRRTGYKQRTGWLAIPTRRMGMVFAKQRVIDYKTWASYNAFETTFDEFFADYERQMAKQFENMMQRKLANTGGAIRRVGGPQLPAMKGKVTGGVTIVRPKSTETFLWYEYNKLWGAWGDKK